MKEVAIDMQERPREAVVLRMVCEQNGLSQNAVGFIAGCSRTWTSQLEAGGYTREGAEEGERVKHSVTR